MSILRMDATPEGVQMLVCINFVTGGNCRFRFFNARVNLNPIGAAFWYNTYRKEIVICHTQ